MDGELSAAWWVASATVVTDPAMLKSRWKTPWLTSTPVSNEERESTRPARAMHTGPDRARDSNTNSTGGT